MNQHGILMHLTLSLVALWATSCVNAGDVITFTRSPLKAIGIKPGVMRRDPSDVIRVGSRYYAWYTKGKQDHGYDASVWYATSEDGTNWTEKGEAIPRGPAGSWDEQSAFTPNILVAEKRYWIYYTGAPKPFIRGSNRVTKTAIGAAVADSPDGPWTKLAGNPCLKTSDNTNDFDSMRVDDACLIIRDGKIWLYYKGRQWDRSPMETKLGVAQADTPTGPFVKHSANPLVKGGHEVTVWPMGKGVMAMLNIGPSNVASTLQYAEDGIRFSKAADLKDVPKAAGTYRPEAFTDSGQGDLPVWGLSIGLQEGCLPFLERFDVTTK